MRVQGRGTHVARRPSSRTTSYMPTYVTQTASPGRRRRHWDGRDDDVKRDDRKTVVGRQHRRRRRTEPRTVDAAISHSVSLFLSPLSFALSHPNATHGPASRPSSRTTAERAHKTLRAPHGNTSGRPPPTDAQRPFV